MSRNPWFRTQVPVQQLPQAQPSQAPSPVSAAPVSAGNGKAGSKPSGVPAPNPQVLAHLQQTGSIPGIASRPANPNIHGNPGAQYSRNITPYVPKIGPSAKKV